jgi:hypothetical protein
VVPSLASRNCARAPTHWRLIGGREGIHSLDLDEDLSVEGLLAGRPSAESQASFKKWLEGRPPRANKRMQQARVTARLRGARRRARPLIRRSLGLQRVHRVAVQPTGRLPYERAK